MTLNRMIMYAYDLNLDQISGGPSWAASSKDAYDVTSKAPGDETPPVMLGGSAIKFVLVGS
jgi:uncharacterized protein (TIGR03435 family)